MERYMPLEKVLQEHGLPYQRVSHSRGPLLLLPFNDFGDRKRLSDLLSTITEIEASMVRKITPPQPTLSSKPGIIQKVADWFRGRQQRPQEIASIPVVAPTESDASDVVKEGLSCRAPRPREVVRRQIERLARRVLSEYNVNVAADLTQDLRGFVIEARR